MPVCLWTSKSNRASWPLLAAHTAVQAVEAACARELLGVKINSVYLLNLYAKMAKLILHTHFYSESKH